MQQVLSGQTGGARDRQPEHFQQLSRCFYATGELVSFGSERREVSRPFWEGTAETPSTPAAAATYFADKPYVRGNHEAEARITNDGRG